MNEIVRGKYCFTGARAKDSAEYYDLVNRHEHKCDTDYLAWDAAHKFGSRVTAVGLASFRNGLVIGKNAVTAAEQIDQEYIRAFEACDVVGRSRKMKEHMLSVYMDVERQYGVNVRVL